MAKKKVFIAVTAYDSRLFVVTMMSILNNIDNLKTKVYDIQLHAKMGDCYIDNVRNDIANTFLKSDCTDLIFVDSDIQFDFNAMGKLLDMPVQVIGGAYPYRSQDMNGFPVKIKVDENGIPVGNVNLKILECDFIPTGLMRIRRDAFEKIIASNPEDKTDRGIYQFFKTGRLFKDEGDHQWYGEDVYFCKVCARNGIIIWCNPDIG